MHKVSFLAAAIISAALLVGAAVAAEPYPARPIRVIDGFSAGGGTDYLARVLARKLTDSFAAAMPLVKAKRLNAIAVTSAKRATALPELPTIAESGFSGFDVTPWYGILLPAKTPPAIVTILNAEIGKVLRMPDVQATFATQAFEAMGSTPERFKAIMADEVKLWARVIKDAGVKAE